MFFRTTYAYDAAGRLDHLVNPWNERASWSYDAAGRVTLERLANGARASSTYDAAGQLTGLAHLKSDGSVLFSFAYLYDNAGNRTRVVEANGDRTTWSYDAASQLVAEYRTGATAYRITHAYDPAGNQLLRTDASGRTTYAYDAADQLQTSDNTSGRTTYVYDAAGNLQAQKASASQITTNVWDAENRLVRVTSPSGAITTMAYRADGLRFSKQDASGTARFLWDDQKLLLESDAANTTQAAYTLVPDEFGQVLSQRRSGVSSFYYHSGIGSAAGLTDNGASVTDSYVYEGFGVMVAQSGSSVNPFRFIGRLGYYFDSPLGQYYIRARHYSPILARWLSQDPLGYLARDVNVYRYVASRPVSLTDPDGLQEKLSHFEVVAKSFINGINALGDLTGRWGLGDFYTPSIIIQLATLAGLGNVIPGIGSRTNVRLAFFAKVSLILLQAFHQNPRTPAKIGDYRLYSKVDVDFKCCGNELKSPTIPFTDKDGGEELFGLHGSMEMTAPKMKNLDPSTIEVWWLGWGHPNYLFEPGLQWVAFRTSINIWHQPTVQFYCQNGVGKYRVSSLVVSAFPSHRVWVNNKQVKEIPKGAFSELWQPYPGDPSFVRRSPSSF